MIAQLRSAALMGVDPVSVLVEVDLQGGVPNFFMVGLPDKAVQESYQRFVAAIRNSGLTLPMTKIVVNLAPGDIRKEGTGFDLPIALGILAASGQVPMAELDQTMILGELGLDGEIRPIDGALNYALGAEAWGVKRLILPAANAEEAAAAGIDVFGVKTLGQAVELLNGSLFAEPIRPKMEDWNPEDDSGLDYRDVKGQQAALRALEVAAAGGHNLLMSGPPGSGKTMLARRMPTILPPLSREEAIAVTRIYSASGIREGRRGLIRARPFRSPHHTSSYAALVGGGKTPRPGEVSLAHHGVLFLDEMPEYGRDVLEALRQPLEDGVVTVSRVQSTLTFPAGCMLIGAMNPCPCGFKGYPEAKCVGAAVCEKYGGRISGPLLDRIDLHVEVPRLKPEELIGRAEGEPSAAIRARVMAARDRQTARYGRAKTNAQMIPREIRELIGMDDECREFMQLAAARLNLSARVFDRLLKVARTIADLAGSDEVRKPHLAEAVQFRGRGLDR